MADPKRTGVLACISLALVAQVATADIYGEETLQLGGGGNWYFNFSVRNTDDDDYLTWDHLYVETEYYLYLPLVGPDIWTEGDGMPVPENGTATLPWAGSGPIPQSPGQVCLDVKSEKVPNEGSAEEIHQKDDCS